MCSRGTSVVKLFFSNKSLVFNPHSLSKGLCNFLFGIFKPTLWITEVVLLTHKKTCHVEQNCIVLIFRYNTEVLIFLESCFTTNQLFNSHFRRHLYSLKYDYEILNMFYDMYHLYIAKSFSSYISYIVIKWCKYYYISLHFKISNIVQTKRTYFRA